MATVPRSPLVHRPDLAVAAAAAAAVPLFLLLAVATLSMSPVAVAVAAGSPELVELTLVAGAREKGAVCLDGSPPAYHFQSGFGTGSNNWLVNIEGGAWCNTAETCSERKMTDLGSSKFMKAIEFGGILSNKHSQNPDFYNWNRVDVRYCDGASFAGDGEGDDKDGTKLFFRGLRIWEAVVDELMGKGMGNAKQVLLVGCSSGGLATLLHCDNFHAKFPRDVLVKCLSDAGFFLDAKDLSGKRFMRSLINGVVHLQNVKKGLPKECLTKKDRTECFFAAELVKSIRTPTFILNSDYDSGQIGFVLVPDESYQGQSWTSCKADIRNCSSTQLDALHGYRNKFVSKLKVVEAKKGWGLFVDSCFTHCQTPFNISWHSRNSPRVGNKTIAEAVGDWYFGRSHTVELIDCKYPCNPTCSSQLPT